jgi:hypothetical protein
MNRRSCAADSPSYKALFGKALFGAHEHQSLLQNKASVFFVFAYATAK